MIAEIATGFQALKSAIGLVETIHAASTEAEVNTVKIGLQRSLLEAQTALFEAQSAQASATSRITDLEQEIVRLKNWETKKERYDLRPVDETAFAYMPKPGMEDGKPPHWLCTTCFENGHPSVLQGQGRKPVDRHSLEHAMIIWRCNACGGQMAVHFHYSPTSAWIPPEEQPRA